MLEIDSMYFQGAVGDTLSASPDISSLVFPEILGVVE
jgi:hypothetical protein